MIHARPYDAAAKGKQERWFRTVRMQLLPMLRDDDTASLRALNRRLWAWVETEYHQNPHRGLGGQCPFDRWAQEGTADGLEDCHGDVVRQVIAQLDLKPGMQSLELGCGTGALTRAILKSFKMKYLIANDLTSAYDVRIRRIVDAFDVPH